MLLSGFLPGLINNRRSTCLRFFHTPEYDFFPLSMGGFYLIISNIMFRRWFDRAGGKNRM